MSATARHPALPRGEVNHTCPPPSTPIRNPAPPRLPRILSDPRPPPPFRSRIRTILVLRSPLLKLSTDALARMPPHMQKAFYSLVEEYAPGTSDGMMGGDKDKVRLASRR